MSILNQTQQDDRIKEMRLKEEEELVKILAERYGLPYIDLSAVPINTDALRLVPEEKARAAGLAAFSVVGKQVMLAIVSPKNEVLKTIQDDLNRLGYASSLFMASKHSVEKAWRLYKEVSYAEETESGVFDISAAEIENLAKQVGTLGDLSATIEKVNRKESGYKTSKLIEIFLAGALATSASDIHIEPEEEYVRLRFRTDGVLHNVAHITHNSYKFVLSRIKLLSGLKLNRGESAQDGRFSVKAGANEIEIRTSVIPGEYGESIVMRILNPEATKVSLDDLGIEEMLFAELKHQLKKPNGMILTTGPTGSGKTTTLYSFLRAIYTPEIKIITIENPIEYHLEGITQTQVNPAKEYTFLSGLRSALRQDPDVIMVGEIRDEETAHTAIDSALTGHLVFSTLHTNNAAGVLPRLIDLGINPKIISSALNISLAQRLVRKLCPECREKHILNEEELTRVKKIMARIAEKRELGEAVPTIWKAPEKEHVCGVCGGIGYKGRIGVFEGIITDEYVEKLILEGAVSETTMAEVAKKQNMLTMTEDALLKVFQGVTSLEELERVVGID